LRYAGIALATGIFIFWATMNTLVVLKQREVRLLNRYRKGVDSFLGTDLLRERWLGIYRNNRKIGYTGSTFEKVYAEEGAEISGRVESRMEMDLLGKRIPVELEGDFTLDASMRPIRLRVDVTLAETIPVSLVGLRRGEKFRITVKQGATDLVGTELPLEEFFLADGLVPALPVSGFAVGERFSVPCFDPVTMSRSVADVTVIARETQEIGGLPTDCFRLETRFRDMTSTSFVTATGELLKQEFGPPLESIVLRRETRDNAKRFFKR
jgi:hypothetical protein